MSSYTKSTDFASKDSLLSGNPLKVVKGTELDDEFNALQTAVNSKADVNSPTLTGSPSAPTASAGTNTTQLATTAYVQTALNQSGYVDTAQLATDAVTQAKMANDSVGAAQIQTNSVSASELNVSGNGSSSQYLRSDGDGSFTWASLPSDVLDGGSYSTPSWSSGSTYTNNSGSTIIVHGSMYVDYGGSNRREVYGVAYVNGSVIERAGQRGYGPQGVNLMVIVPNGSTWRIDLTTDEADPNNYDVYIRKFSL